MTDASSDRSFEEFHESLEPLVRANDWEPAEVLCRSHLERAESINDAEGAAIFAGFLATVLSAAGRDADALEAAEIAERHVPSDAYLKIQVARRLLSNGARVEESLAKLDEAEPLLKGDERSLWLSEKGLLLLAAGQDAEAVECFAEITLPENLAKMRELKYLGFVDLRLVGNLITKGLAKEMCNEYLAAVECVAAHDSGPIDAEMLRELKNRVHSDGA